MFIYSYETKYNCDNSGILHRKNSTHVSYVLQKQVDSFVLYIRSKGNKQQLKRKKEKKYYYIEVNQLNVTKKGACDIKMVKTHTFELVHVKQKSTYTSNTHIFDKIEIYR